jgi:hypothetical protein
MNEVTTINPASTTITTDNNNASPENQESITINNITVRNIPLQEESFKNRREAIEMTRTRLKQQQQQQQ